MSRAAGAGHLRPVVGCAGRIAGALLLGLAQCRDQPAPAPAAARGEAQDRYRQPERLVAALGLVPGWRVAEIGAGGGYLTPRLWQAVRPGGHVVATDIDAAALAALRGRVVAEGYSEGHGAGHTGIETRLVEPADPGLEPGVYQRVLLAQVDHLLPDRTAYLRALLPALAPGGCVAISNVERHRAAVELAARTLHLTVRDPLSGRPGLPGQFLLLVCPPKT